MGTFHHDSANLLRYTLGENERSDPFTWQLLREDCPASVLPVGRNAQDLLLPIAGLTPMERALAQGLSPRAAALQLLRAIRDAREHLIPTGELLLSLPFLYYKEETGQVLLLCLPTDGAGSGSEPTRQLFRSVFAAAVTRESPYRAEISEALCYLNGEDYTPEGMVQRLQMEKPPAEPKVNCAAEEAKVSLGERVKKFLSGEPTAELPDLSDRGDPDDLYFLTVRATGLEFPLGEERTVIGSDPEQADLCLPCNVFAEAAHAAITRERGGYYAADLQTKTGLRLNGRKVRPWRPERLESGDVLRIGEDEIVFSRRKIPK